MTRCYIPPEDEDEIRRIDETKRAWECIGPLLAVLAFLLCGLVVSIADKGVPTP